MTFSAPLVVSRPLHPARDRRDPSRGRLQPRSASVFAAALAVGALLVGCGDDSLDLTATAGESASESSTSVGESSTSVGQTATSTSTSTATATATESDGTTTGEPPPSCGNGELDGADELCDDGNNVDGDGCNADCTLSGTELERVLLPELGWFTKIGLDPAGDILACGSSSVDETSRAWLAKFDPEGALLWEYIDPDENTESSFSDFAVDGDRIVVAGWAEAESRASLLAVISSADGSALSSDLIDLDDDSDLFTDVVLADAQTIGMVWLGAALRPVVYSLGADLTPTWTYEPMVDNASSGTLSRTADGHTLVAVAEVLDASTHGIFVAKIADDGAPVWTRSYSDPSARYTPNDLVVDSDGRSFLCGEVEQADESDTFLLGMDAEGDELWRATFPIAGPGRDMCTALALSDDGAVAFSGTAFTQSGGWDGRGAKVDADTGVLRWSRTITGSDKSGTDVGNGIAALPGGEVIIAAGLDGSKRALVRLSP